MDYRSFVTEKARVGDPRPRYACSKTCYRRRVARPKTYHAKMPSRVKGAFSTKCAHALRLSVKSRR